MICLNMKINLILDQSEGNNAITYTSWIIKGAQKIILQNVKSYFETNLFYFQFDKGKWY